MSEEVYVVIVAKNPNSELTMVGELTILHVAVPGCEIHVVFRPPYPLSRGRLRAITEGRSMESDGIPYSQLPNIIKILGQATKVLTHGDWSKQYLENLLTIPVEKVENIVFDPSCKCAHHQVYPGLGGMFCTKGYAYPVRRRGLLMEVDNLIRRTQARVIEAMLTDPLECKEELPKSDIEENGGPSTSTSTSTSKFAVEDLDPYPPACESDDDSTEGLYDPGVSDYVTIREEPNRDNNAGAPSPNETLNYYALILDKGVYNYPLILEAAADFRCVKLKPEYVRIFKDRNGNYDDIYCSTCLISRFSHSPSTFIIFERYHLILSREEKLPQCFCQLDLFQVEPISKCMECFEEFMTHEEVLRRNASKIHGECRTVPDRMPC